MEKNWPDITIDTPIDELQKIHKDIWDYVIKHGEKPDTQYHSNCVGCQYATIVFDMVNEDFDEDEYFIPCMCKYCPIIWPDGLKCGGYKSLYSKFFSCEYGSKEGADIARQIRDLPFKDVLDSQ